MAAPRLHADLVAQGGENTGVRTAFVTSVKAGLGATLIALVLGSMIAFAVQPLPVLRARRCVASSSSCRSRCPASSPASRSTRRSA